MKKGLDLRTLTDAEWDDFLTGDLYNMAKKYASDFPVPGEPFEDFVQDLVIGVWRKRLKFDIKRASVSTFAYWTFQTTRTNLLNKRFAKKRNCEGTIVNVDNFDDASGLATEAFLEDAGNATPERHAEFVDTLANLHEYTRLFISGYTINEIAKGKGVSKDFIKGIIVADLKSIERQKV